MRRNMITSEQIFKGMGLKEIPINNEIMYQASNGHIYRVDEGETFVAIEYAENEEDAKRNAFDDADLFEKNKGNSVADFLSFIKSEIKSYIV